MSYYGYELNGDQYDDRKTVARALDDPFLSESEKQAIVDEHNWKHVDSLSTDTYMNRIVHGVSNDYPISYGNIFSNDTETYTTYEYQESTPKPKEYKVMLSEGHLLFDDKNA